LFFCAHHIEGTLKFPGLLEPAPFRRRLRVKALTTTAGQAATGGTIMLNRIVAVTLVALLSLTLAGKSIAAPTGGQNDPAQMFQQIMQTISQCGTCQKPTQGGGPKVLNGGLLDNGGGSFNHNAPAPTGTPLTPAASRGAAGQTIK
jgi:hypothetical protein